MSAECVETKPARPALGSSIFASLNQSMSERPWCTRCWLFQGSAGSLAPAGGECAEWRGWKRVSPKYIRQCKLKWEVFEIMKILNVAQLTNYRQCVCPSNPAQSNVKAICIGSANLSKLIRVPAEREADTSHNHRNRCKDTEKTCC